MATTINRKSQPIPFERLTLEPLKEGMARYVERDFESPNLALINVGKDQRAWTVLNVNQQQEASTAWGRWAALKRASANA